MIYEIHPDHPLRVSEVKDILVHGRELVLSEKAKSRIVACRQYLDDRMQSQNEPIYGINTGFGALYNQTIGEDDLGTLQKNLLLSHACGMGEEVPEEVVRLMLLLKVKGLSYGHSGVQLDTVQRLIDFFNKGITPIVYTLGSLGASGDLAPLSHLCLPLIGEGEVRYNGNRMTGEEALAAAGLSPIQLHSKEGLALINGTQFMSAFGVHIAMRAGTLFRGSESIAALSLDAFDGRIEPFDDLLHQVRNHAGQRSVAARFRSLLEGSQIISRKKTHVQDPYSFRCIPQVHGASCDTLSYVISVLETEINSVTDNPIIFPEQDKIISGGNFHGQPLALILDQVAIAMAEMTSISERRVYKLISGQRELPAFLVSNPGLNSGFMIPQYTAASMVSQNKQLCTPASVDTIDSSNGQEDHVSMGANAATKAYRVLQNLRRVLAIELLTAAQALEFRRPLRSSDELEALHTRLRRVVPMTKNDHYWSEALQKTESQLESLVGDISF